MTKDERVAVVSGGTRGIGAAVADELLDKGWRVIAIARSIPTVCGGTSTIGSMGGSDRRGYIAADLSTEKGIHDALVSVSAITNRLDLLINNAGGIGAEERFAEVSYDAFERSFRLNLLAGFFMARGLQPLLCRGELPSVVNIGSVYGWIPDTDVVAYSLSKSAIPLLTQTMARVLGPTIRANCILPGHVDTEMTRAAPAEFLNIVRRVTILKRVGSAAEIAGIVSFLASSSASFMTGACIVADGGFMTGRSEQHGCQ